ncbi:hypothetical protein [Paenibacillus sp. 32O-W]|nr:hypothetical protein [Paenibacillus sp. 32O-W]
MKVELLSLQENKNPEKIMKAAEEAILALIPHNYSYMTVGF